MSPAKKPQKPTKAKLQTAAKAAGLDLLKKGKGYALVNAETGTLVADDWAGEDGLTLDPLEAVLKGEAWAGTRAQGFDNDLSFSLPAGPKKMVAGWGSPPAPRACHTYL